MRKLLITLGAMGLALPATAQDVEEIATNLAIIASVQEFAQITTSSTPAPARGTDSFIAFEQSDAGEVYLSGLGRIPSGTAMPLIPDTAAIVRIRYDMPRRASAPLPADAAYVALHRSPIFIFHQRRQRMWEVGLVSGTPMFRDIGDDGAAGEWQAFPESGDT